MIRAIFIVRQGICVFSATYEIKLDASNDLLAGFLSALPAFAKEIDDSQELREFKISDYQFSFKLLKNSTESGNFIIVLADAKDKSEALNKILEMLAERFEENYDLDKWNNNLDIFKSFREHADELLFNRPRKPLEVTVEMLETISDSIADSKYNYLVLNRDNDIVLTSLKHISKNFTSDTLNDIKDAVIQYSVFPPVFGTKLETSFINTDRLILMYDKILDHFFIAFQMKDEDTSGKVNAWEMVQEVMEALDEIRFSLMTFFVAENF